MRDQGQGRPWPHLAELEMVPVAAVAAVAAVGGVVLLDVVQLAVLAHLVLALEEERLGQQQHRHRDEGHQDKERLQAALAGDELVRHRHAARRRAQISGDARRAVRARGCIFEAGEGTRE